MAVQRPPSARSTSHAQNTDETVRPREQEHPLYRLSPYHSLDSVTLR